MAFDRAEVEQTPTRNEHDFFRYHWTLQTQAAAVRDGYSRRTLE